MTRKHKHLHKLWATGKATMRQMQRCMELDRKAKKDVCRVWPKCACIVQGEKPADCPPRF